MNFIAFSILIKFLFVQSLKLLSFLKEYKRIATPSDYERQFRIDGDQESVSSLITLITDHIDILCT